MHDTRQSDQWGPKSYGVSHLVVNLGWVELDLGSSLGWLAIQWVPTAQAGWWNIPNPSQWEVVTEETCHPIYNTSTYHGSKFCINLNQRDAYHSIYLVLMRSSWTRRVSMALQAAG